MQFEQSDRNLVDTRYRLVAWGRWYNLIITSGLDYARTSIIGQLMESKGTIIRSTVKNYMPENEEAEAIERLIHELREEKPQLGEIIKYHYSYNKKPMDKAIHFNLKKRNYLYFLLQAEKWIDRCLH